MVKVMRVVVIVVIDVDCNSNNRNDVGNTCYGGSNDTVKDSKKKKNILYHLHVYLWYNNS